MDRVEPVIRFAPGGMSAISPSGRIQRRRREDGDEPEQGRKDEHGADDGLDDEELDDGRPHVDVLA